MSTETVLCRAGVLKQIIARAVCESPEVSSQYLAAAKLWYKMHKIINAVPYNEKYTNVVESLENANTIGHQGGDCSQFSW